MSTSKPNDLAPGSDSVTLRVTTEDKSAEIFIIDGQFNLVARGIGPTKDFELAPGLYKVKITGGNETREEQVALRPGSAPVLQEFSRLVFASPAPLADTSKTHEFHIEAAIEQSRLIHVQAGAGSKIFVFARGWTEKQRTDSDTHQRQHPATGLKLLNETGETAVVDFETQSEKDLGWEPWAACNVSVNPGNYRLRLDVPSLNGTIEQTVVASPGWQTQIFLLQRDYSEDQPQAESPTASRKQADLLNASVLMSRGGFDYDRNDLRSVELARLALTNQRKVLSGELRQLLRDKFENPMLGIFGAHLLLLDNEPDKELFGIVVNKLRDLVGPAHPDVEALALQLPQSSNYQFKSPPMLQRSWSLICQATADKPELVPSESVLAGVSGSWWGNSIWLSWLTPQPGSENDFDEASDESELGNVEEAILLKLKSATYKERRSRSRSRRKPLDVEDERQKRAPTAAAMAVGAESMSIEDTQAAEVESASAVEADNELTSAVQQISADPETIKNLTRQLGVPRSVVEKSVETLKQKISDKRARQ